MQITAKVDFYEFLASAQFANISLGDTREWLLSSFPLPQNKSKEMLHHDEIWFYGSLELHFSNDRLTTICCDDFKNIDLGPFVCRNGWLFTLPGVLTLADIIMIFNTVQFNYIVKHQPKDSDIPIQLYLPDSNILLFFDHATEAKKDGNESVLVGFSHSIIDNEFLPHFIYD